MSRPRQHPDPGAVVVVVIRHGVSNAARWSGVTAAVVARWARSAGVPPLAARAGLGVWLDELDPLCGCGWCADRRRYLRVHRPRRARRIERSAA